MTELILKWLNKEVKLSREINSVERDFSNGFYFAELLVKYKQIPTITKFFNSSNHADKVHNFTLLDKTFKDFGIRLSPEQYKQLIESKKNLAQLVLYQIRRELAKKEINFDNIMLKNSHLLHDMYKKMTYPKIQTTEYTKVTTIGENKLPLITNQNYSGKFDEDKFYNSIENDIKLNEKTLEIQKLEKKQIIYNQQKKFHEQNLENDRVGQENFDKNLSLMNAWERSQKQMDNKEVEFFKKHLFEQFEGSKKENLMQIDIFDRNMARLGLDIATIDPKLKKSNKVQISSEMLMQKIKEKLEANQQARKEKEKRQRKIFYEQNKAQQELQKAKRLKELENDNFDFSSNSNKDNIINSEKVKHEIEIKKNSHDKALEFERWRYIHDRNLKVFMRNKNLYEKLEIQQPYDESRVENFTFQRSQLERNNVNQVEFNEELYFKELDKVNLDWFKSKLEKKKKKRNENMILLSDVLDSILDLVDEAYSYQTKNNKELIEIDTWREWMDSFIQNKPINQYKYFVKEKKDDENESTDPYLVELNRFGKYDENEEDFEFFDFEFFSGKWRDVVFEENLYAIHQLKITDVIPDKELSALLGINDSFGRNLDRDFELKDEHIEYLTIPTENCPNVYFSEMIQSLIEIKYVHYPIYNINNNFFGVPLYESDSVYKLKPSILANINVKISLIGHKFAGKATLAKMLSDQFTWLKVFSITDILGKYFDILKKVETPIESHPKFKTFKKPQIEQMQKEKEAEEQKISHIKDKILLLRSQKERGEDLDEEIIVNMLLESISQEFDNKEVSCDDIISKNKRKAEIQEELAKIKEEQAKKPKTKVKEEQQLQAELAKLNSSFSGFILVDFPTNIRQAKLFERKLTNFIAEIEKVESPFDKVKKEFSSITTKHFKPNFTRPSATPNFNKIIILDCPNEECIRRTVLKRIDPDKGTIYHLEDNPPDQKLLDKLKPLEDAMNEESITKIIINNQ